MKKTKKLLQAKKIYNEIFAVLNKHKDFIKFNLRELRGIKEKHLFQKRQNQTRKRKIRERISGIGETN